MNRIKNKNKLNKTYIIKNNINMIISKLIILVNGKLRRELSELSSFNF